MYAVVGGGLTKLTLLAAVMAATTAPAPTWQSFEATAYTATCEGCSGITATGLDVRNTTTAGGRTIIATDPAVVPMGATVELRLDNGKVVEALAADKGSAIKGGRIDVLMGDRASAMEFGRQTVKLRIIKEDDAE